MGDGTFGSRLLIVDDEPSIGRLIRRVGEGSGFEVMVADDPGSFAKMARSWHPTVIVVDLKMPNIDGVQLLRDLAADKCEAHIVVASGADGKVLEAARQLGRERGLKMSGMLQKPIRIEALRELLAAFKPMPKAVLSRALAEAIAANQLFIEYQPKLDLRLGQITGVEALVRWRHPVHGLMQPDQFVGLAEEGDLIHRLTDWVVGAATRQAALWNGANLALEVAVNISARDLEDLDLPERLQARCGEAGVDPAAITLELTESSAMCEAVQMMDVLTRLRLKGFRLAIDDFGTGYSSLAQLQRMPFSELKIDRSFVAQMAGNQDCRIIVEIVCDLARKLGLRSVAEGVEAEAVLDCLCGLGCDMAQGYFVSRPLAVDSVAAFVRQYKMPRAVSRGEAGRVNSPA